jgi:hypothetical protein
MLQSFAVGFLVAGSAIYALWTLCPKAPRSRVAAKLLKLPHPLWLDKHLTQAAKRQGGCGCDGCDRSELRVQASNKPAKHADQRSGMLGGQTVQPLVFHPRVGVSKAVQSKSS